jgi:hypothetical protein
MEKQHKDRYADVRERLFTVVGVGILLAIGIGVLGFAEQHGEFLVVKACFAGIALCLCACYWLWWLAKRRSRNQKVIWGFATAVAAACVLGISFPWIDGKERERAPPDISLCFVGRQHPSLWALNLSDNSIENGQFGAPALFDVDGPTPDDPLQITGQNFELIAPHGMSGGVDIFSNMHGSSLPKDGNRIFGTVGIKCAKCAVGRSFYVSITWGTGGWFSQMKNDTSGDTVLLMNATNPTHHTPCLQRTCAMLTQCLKKIEFQSAIFSN